MAAAILCAFLTNSHRWLGINDLFATPRSSDVLPPCAFAQARRERKQIRNFTWASGSIFVIFTSFISKNILPTLLGRTMASVPKAAGGVCTQIVRAHCLLSST